MEEESFEYEVIVLEEEQQADPGLKLACDENDIFKEDGITDSQLERAVNAPIQEDPEGPAQSHEVEEILPPEPMEVAECERDSADPGRDGQEMGLEDPSLSP